MVTIKDDTAARLGRFAGADMCQCMMGIDHALNQRLDLAATLFLAKQTRLDHARVVKHQHIACPQIVHKIGEHAVFECGAGHMQQAAATAHFRRKLRDQMLGQVVIKVR